MLKIYLLEQDSNNEYDTYDSMVIIARSPTEAVKLSWEKGDEYSWARPTCKLVGEAKISAKPGIVCASFNAG